MTAVKICGLTRVEHALWAAECGADLLGFIFYPASPRAVAPEQAAEIAAAIRSVAAQAAPLMVGVFVNESQDVVRDVYARCNLDLVQLHGDESPEAARALGLPYILARRMGQPGVLLGLDEYAPWAYLLDSYDPSRAGGSGAPWDWNALDKQLPAGTRCILAGGLTPGNVQDGLRAVRPWGVDVASGVEQRPGVKNPDRVAAFIRQVKEYDRHDSDN
ncbi:MAG: phosphoribosylanthranilate isomerase [Anaerolineae bacterium]